MRLFNSYGNALAKNIQLLSDQGIATTVYPLGKRGPKWYRKWIRRIRRNLVFYEWWADAHFKGESFLRILALTFGDESCASTWYRILQYKPFLAEDGFWILHFGFEIIISSISGVGNVNQSAFPSFIKHRWQSFLLKKISHWSGLRAYGSIPQYFQRQEP